MEKCLVGALCLDIAADNDDFLSKQATHLVFNNRNLLTESQALQEKKNELLDYWSSIIELPQLKHLVEEIELKKGTLARNQEELCLLWVEYCCRQWEIHDLLNSFCAQTKLMNLIEKKSLFDLLLLQNLEAKMRKTRMEMAETLFNGSTENSLRIIEDGWMKQKQVFASRLMEKKRLLEQYQGLGDEFMQVVLEYDRTCREIEIVKSDLTFLECK